MVITIWFARGRGFISTLIRWLLLSPWDRVGIDFDDGYIVESSVGQGVIIRSHSSFINDTDKHVKLSIDISDLDRQQSRTFIRSELNKKYDWLKTFNLPTSYEYDMQHWLSTELFIKSLDNTAVALKLTESRVTPFDLWCMMLKHKTLRE